MHISPFFLILVLCLVVTCHNPCPGASCIALLSDLEGNQTRFERFLALHPAFESKPDGKRHLRSDAVFVFGGDAPDRFFGERHVLRELLRLKQETPDRVILIAGNRDVNKLRLPLELSAAGMATGPHTGKPEYQNWCRKQNRDDIPASRLRWMLEQTMGSPLAFELRREELAREQHQIVTDIDEEAVVASYLEDSRPGGLFHQYLKAACLMARQGPTLFVHAGIPQASLGHIPGSTTREGTVDFWAAQLNTWMQRQIELWEIGFETWNGSLPRPGEDLIRYAERWGGQSANPFSVLYGRTMDDDGKVTLPPPPVIQWLHASGIRRLVVGHTPSGQIPVVQRTADGNFEFLVLDTSYGLADEPPLVTIGGLDGSLTAFSCPIDLPGTGRTILEFTLQLGTPGPLGRRTEDGAILVAPVADGWLSYQLEPGYKVRYNVRSSPR